MRAWIEQGFKDCKRGGWQWHQTKMTDPDRAARLWLAIAVPTLWVVSVGGAGDPMLPTSSIDMLSMPAVPGKRTTQRTRPRLLSCFRRGMLLILAALIDGRSLPRGQFVPEPWPT